jgi:uncharacterized protein (TIGR03437 family)
MTKGWPLFLLSGMLGAAQHPLYFEQRQSDLFKAGTVAIRPDRIEIDDVKLRFVGTSERARLEGVGTPAPGTWFSRQGTVRLRQFQKVRNSGLYRGVNAVFYGNPQQFEYDLEIAPRGDIGSIRLKVEGGHAVHIDDGGNLIIEGKAGEIRQMAPRVFEEHGSTRREIDAKYLLQGDEITFELGKHDAKANLTVDPVVVYQKYFGGSGIDRGGPVATDANGNVYVTGSSDSIDFPATNGSVARITSPLLAFSNGGQTAARLPVGTQVSATAIGGTPDGKVLYVATPGGIYVSSNDGAIFAQTAPLGKTVQVQGISVDPIDPSRAFLATTGGLFVGSAAGQSWGEIDQGMAISGTRSVNASSVLISPADHTVTFAITSSPNYIYRTTNAGGTWQQLFPAYPGEPPAPQFPSTTLTMALTADGKTFYVIDGNGVLLQSADNGNTWKQLAGQMYGAKSITVDANGGSIYVVDNFGLQLSTDGGQTFKTVSPALPGGDVVVAFAKDGSGALYFTTTGGEFEVSTDGGVNWTQLPRRPNIHALAGLGGQVFAAVDSASIPFVTKWSADGSTLLYSTFFGGSYSDAILAIQVEAQGEAIIAGSAASPDFPMMQTLSPSPLPFASGFVAKLSADGSKMVYSTLFGASKGLSVNGLAIDSGGAPYVTGTTSSTDYSTTPNSFQTASPTTPCQRPNSGPLSPTTNLGTFAFVTKFKADGSDLVYSTYLTGSCGSSGQAIAVNAAGEAVIAGFTTSPDFPVSAGAYQPAFPGGATASGAFPNPSDFGFVSRLSAGGDKLIAGTLVGGGFHTEANGVALDRTGNAYVTGSTWGITPGPTPGAFQKSITTTCILISIGPPLPPQGGSDVFVLKLDPSLSTAGFLTYLGGGCTDTGSSIALAPNGNVWVSGVPWASDFPLVTPYEYYGTGSGFVSELSADASQLLYSTFADGSNIAIDPSGAAYVSGSGLGLTGPAKNSSVAGTGPFLVVGSGTSASLTKIDPNTLRTVVISSMGPATAFQITPQASAPSRGPVAPGELIAITGQHLGPQTTLNAQLDATGRLPFTLGTTTVRFNNLVAPLLSVQDGLIVCMAPFEVSGITELTVSVDGQSSEGLRVQVSQTVPYILSVTNQDGTPNGPDHPAPQGSVVTLYMTGLGVTTPLSQDGTVNAMPLPVPVVPLGASINGTTVPIQFGGAASGLLAGITQVNVYVPVAQYTQTPSYIGVNSGQAPIYIGR